LEDDGIRRVDRKLVKALSQPIRELRWGDAPEPLRTAVTEETLSRLILASVAAIEEGRRRATGDGSNN
jgi:hypothetical protein